MKEFKKKPKYPKYFHETFLFFFRFFLKKYFTFFGFIEMKEFKKN